MLNIVALQGKILICPTGLDFRNPVVFFGSNESEHGHFAMSAAGDNRIVMIRGGSLIISNLVFTIFVIQIHIETQY